MTRKNKKFWTADEFCEELERKAPKIWVSVPPEDEDVAMVATTEKYGNRNDGIVYFVGIKIDHTLKPGGMVITMSMPQGGS